MYLCVMCSIEDARKRELDKIAIGHSGECRALEHMLNLARTWADGKMALSNSFQDCPADGQLALDHFKKCLLLADSVAN